MNAENLTAGASFADVLDADGDAFELSKIQRQLAILAEHGTVGANVLAGITKNNRLLPVECDVLDYKQAVGKDHEPLRILKTIVAFYNTYGGYIIVGVKEIADGQEYVAAGHLDDKLESQQLEHLLKHYTGDSIQFALMDVDFSGNQLQIICVPKRGGGNPLMFVRAGNADNGKKIFEQDKYYFREGTEVIEATGKKLQLLFSLTKRHPAIELSTDQASLRKLEHNLPDSKSICEEFVGREIDKSRLWEWLYDDTRLALVVAGEGGLGKTSLVYDFCNEVREAPPRSLDRIIWLSAKSKRFLAPSNRFESLANADFSTYENLLQRLNNEFAIPTDDLEGLSARAARRQLISQFRDWPSLIVIDDLDSLDSNDQTQVLDFALSLTGTTCKTILTTRKNLTFSTERCLALKGLESAEFEELIDVLKASMPGCSLTSSEIKKLHEVSNGSPLFTQSIWRFLRRGDKFEKVIGDWKSHLGADVRKAACERELRSLSAEAKRTIVAASILGSATFVEIRQATELSDETVDQAIEELRSLFLVSTPAIASEPRFRVEGWLCAVIEDLENELISDPSLLRKHINSLRNKTAYKISQEKARMVVDATNEALAHLRNNDRDAALNLIAVALKKTNDHGDLQELLGRVHLTPPTNVTAARDAFIRAYDLGCRSQSLFESWYALEMQERNFHAANEIADRRWSAREDVGWLRAKVIPTRQLALENYRSGDLALACKRLADLADEIKKSLDAKPKVGGDLLRDLFDLHEDLYRYRRLQNGSREEKTLRIYDEIRMMMNRGDRRKLTITRLADLISTLEKITSSVYFRQEAEAAYHALQYIRTALRKDGDAN